MRQLYPQAGRDLPVVTAPASGPLPPVIAECAALYRNVADARPAGRPSRSRVRANMVASTDGAVSVDGRSGGLSGPADKMIFGILRSLADVILVGAGTALTERYRPVSAGSLWTALRPEGAPPPPVAIVTESLRLEQDDRLLSVPADGSQTIVITTAAAPADRKQAIGKHARIIEAGDSSVDLGAAVSALADLGHVAILCEGGPTLLGQLAGADLLDELCLTTSPVLAAGRAGRIVMPLPGGPPASGPAARLRLAHLLTDESFLFSRYLRDRRPPPPE